VTTLTLVIGNKNYSSWSLRPWLFMRHAGIPFAERRVALSTATTAAELAELDSNGKVPVLLDAEFVVWDSLAILEYLSEKFLQGAGWPADARLRALGRCVSAEMHSSFAALRRALPMNCRKRFPGFPISGEVGRDIERVQSLWARCYQGHGRTQDWLLGEFSIADAMYAPVALRFHGYDVKLSEPAQAYVKKVLGHPAVGAWMDAAARETEVIVEEEVAI
jgi:glutathione S-transferase